MPEDNLPVIKEALNEEKDPNGNSFQNTPRKNESLSALISLNSLVGGLSITLINCPACGKQVQPDEGYSCPECRHYYETLIRHS